jgi:fluoroquinolone transport system permease protein
MLASLAANTVEGIAVSKFSGLRVVAPVGVIALATPPWGHLGGLFPAYLPALALVRAVEGRPGVTLALAVGAGYGVAVIWLLDRRFVRRAD